MYAIYGPSPIQPNQGQQLPKFLSIGPKSSPYLSTCTWSFMHQEVGMYLNLLRDRECILTVLEWFSIHLPQLLSQIIKDINTDMFNIQSQLNHKMLISSIFVILAEHRITFHNILREILIVSFSVLLSKSNYSVLAEFHRFVTTYKYRFITRLQFSVNLLL